MSSTDQRDGERCNSSQFVHEHHSTQNHHNNQKYNNNHNHPFRTEFNFNQQREEQPTGTRFGHTYPDYDNNYNHMMNTRKKKQRTLVRNELGTFETDLSWNNGNSQSLVQQQDWEQIGQIGSYHPSSNIGTVYDDVLQNMDGTAASKKKKKRNKHKQNKKTKKKRPMPDIRAMMSPGHQNSHTNHDNEANGEVDVHGEGAIPIASLEESNPNLRRKSKKARRKPDNINTIANDNAENDNHANLINAIPLDTFTDFVETYDVKNAGSSSEALREFLRIIRSQDYVTWTMVFHDKSCSTPMVTSSKKYCTPKGPKCMLWNCTCENNIRAMQAVAPLVGAFFVFPMDSEDKSNLDCFLLPLGPTSDPEDGQTQNIDGGYERMAHWPFLTITCDTTLQQRWETLRTILLDKRLTCVTYNAQVALMPYHYHSANDVQQDENTRSETGGFMDLVLPNIWDLKLASWMLSPHVSEEDLELENKRSEYSHLLERQQNDSRKQPENTSKQYLGLVHAKEELEFLYSVYPVVDKLLVDNGMKIAFEDIEAPIQSVLSAMECHGIGFKASRLQQIQTKIESRIEELNAEARSISNDSEFKLSSPQQVSLLLYDKMGIEVPTERVGNATTSHRSTSEDTLNLIQNNIKSQGGQGLRIIEILLEFRGLSKMLNTYIRAYPKLARESNTSSTFVVKKKKRSKKSKRESQICMKIYPTWMQTAVRTGRLSCRKPNLQQIPTGKLFGVFPRNAFITSSKESCFFACDYSQNEVRILAHMSGDKALISLFTQPGTTDIYKQMSSVVTGKEIDSVSDKERSIAKQVTLAIIYGMGINNVAQKLSITKSTAQTFFQSFYGRFPGVKQWMDRVKKSARQCKHVKTITGRIRYLDNIDSDSQKLRSQAERQAVNTIIQGSAADLIKLAMLKMASRLTDWRKEGATGDGSGVPPKLLLQIHDELVFELVANEADVTRFKSIVCRCCTEECVQELHLEVPLKLKCSIGTSWGNMKEI
mmetsp:Transcript_816/g.1120  ORF Transcript_816/g.1120 Transcript_816/m.1120 type:complete len:994 (-) Transcript_816:252-3233(-)